MPYQSVEEAIASLVEPLAAIEHERWAHWQRYLHSKCIETSDGMVQFAADLFHRWTIQLQTPYANLSEGEKESDRQEVRKYLPLLEKALLEQREAGRAEERQRRIESGHDDFNPRDRGGNRSVQ